MPQKKSKLNQFWQELKRRRVVHVITVYASASFVLIELVNNLSEPLNLPPKLATIMVVILAVGFPLAVILAWIYDLTPEGIEKTGPSVGDEGKQTGNILNAWRIATYVSFVVIAGLITLNLVGGSKELSTGDIRSLVILPFDNFTGDEKLDYFVEGMHASLIGDMGQLGGLQVKSRTSASAFKDKDMTIPEIATELGTDAALETAVMCLGDTICLQFRLVRTSGDEEQLWVGEYKEDKGQLLNLYNRVTKQIAQEVLVELTASEEHVLNEDRAEDRDAMDAYIRSHAYWGDLSAEAFDKAEEFLGLAMEKDPDWATLYAAMAIVWGGRMQMGMIDIETGRKQIKENIARARELDVDFTDSHFINAILFTWPDWEWEKGEKEFLQAISHNPNHVMARMYYAHLLMILQRMDEALIQGKLAVELDPKNPLVLTLYAVVLKGARKDHEVLERLEEALSIDPDHAFTRGQLGRAYYNLGEYEKDLELEETYLSRRLGRESVPDLDSIYRLHGKQEAYQELARLWELYAENHSYRPISKAQDFYRAGRYSDALDELEKALEMHEPNLPYFGTGTRYKALHDSTRFLAILDSMNLPHPVKQKNP